MKKLIKHWTRYEQKGNDLLILTSIPLACAILSWGLLILLGEPTPWKMLVGGCLAFLTGYFAHSQRRRREAETH